MAELISQAFWVEKNVKYSQGTGSETWEFFFLRIWIFLTREKQSKNKNPSMIPEPVYISIWQFSIWLQRPYNIKSVYRENLMEI